MWDIPAAEKAVRLFEKPQDESAKARVAARGGRKYSESGGQPFRNISAGGSEVPCFAVSTAKSSPQERAYKDDLRLSISAPSKMELGDG